MFLWVSKDSFGFFRPSHIVFVVFSASLRVPHGFTGLSSIHQMVALPSHQSGIDIALNTVVPIGKFMSAVL